MTYQAVLHIVIAALVSVPVLGAVFTLGMSFLSAPDTLTNYPRVVAAYRLACRVFPDLSDPKALAADVVRLVLGTPLALVLAFVAWNAQGCATLRAVEPVVVQSADTACQVVSMLTAAGIVQAVCIAFDDLVRLERELLAAQAAGRSARVRIVGRDGSVVDAEVDIAHLADAIDSVAKAKIAAMGAT
jgi:hypothetical protein